MMDTRRSLMNLKYLLAVFPSDDSIVRTTILYTNDTETEINSIDDISDLEGPFLDIQRRKKGSYYLFIKF